MRGLGEAAGRRQRDGGVEERVHEGEDEGGTVAADAGGEEGGAGGGEAHAAVLADAVEVEVAPDEGRGPLHLHGELVHAHRRHGPVAGAERRGVPGVGNRLRGPR